MKYLFLVILILLNACYSINAKDIEIDNTINISKIQKIINECEIGSSIFFKAGIYSFTNLDVLKIKKNELTLKGDNEHKTIFRFANSGEKFRGFISIDSSNSILIQYIVFDGNNKNSYKPSINIGPKNKNISVNNCMFSNMINSDGQMYAIIISALNVSNFNISDNQFKNISSMGDGKVGSSKGMCGGILFLTNKVTINDFASTGNINKNIFDSIYLQRIGDEIDYDADGIRFYVPTDTETIRKRTKNNIKISNNTFINVEKSAIKIQSFPGIIINNNSIESNMKTQYMLAGIRIYGDYQKTRNITITENVFKGNIQRCAILNGYNVLFKNNIYHTTLKNKYPALQIGHQQESKKIKIVNFIFESDQDKFNIVNKASNLKLEGCYIQMNGNRKKYKFNTQD